MNYADPQLRNQLAAEYVLGTLSGVSRRRFEEMLSGDRALNGLVEDWELTLSPIAETVAPVEPPASLWADIDRKIAPPPQPATERGGMFARLWDSPGFWRGAAAVATATACALFAVAVLRPRVAPERIAALDERLARIEDATRGLAGVTGEMTSLDDRLNSLGRRIEVLAGSPTHVAVLLDRDQRPMMNADFNASDGRLVLRLNLTPHRDFSVNVLEVWVVAADGTRRSLGVFPSEHPGTTTALVLPPDTAAAVAQAQLSVTLEPKGGSRTGQPSGPVLFTGHLVPFL